MMGSLKSTRARLRRVKAGHVVMSPDDVMEMETRSRKRGYAAAEKRARFGDFRVSRGSADYELRQGLVAVRAKSRYLARNSSFMRRFLWLLAINVVGKKGFIFQSRVKRLDGTPDASLNERVNTDFKRWSKRPTTCGQLSFTDLQKQAVKTLARDGEVIWELVFNSKYADGFAINPMEADLLDVYYNTQHTNGNEIKMGVELDIHNAPVAYHFLTHHPGEATYFSFERKRSYRRVPVSRVRHVFISDRPGQTRGEPWGATVINSIKMVDGYREAETTGRRLKSSIMGFFQRIMPGAQGIAELSDQIDENDNMLEMSMEPGMLKELSPGLEFKSFDPGGAQTDFAEFENQIKKDVSMGLMISNMSLGMETQGVSYSAGRTISLEDRDFYQDVQGFMIDRMLEPICDVWLSRRVLQDDSNIPPTRIAAIRENCIFRPRGWDWVDPAKDVRANKEALETGQTSLARVAAARGIDEDELLDEIQETQRKLTERGLTLPLLQSNTNSNQSNDDDSDDDADQNQS